MTQIFFHAAEANDETCKKRINIWKGVRKNSWDSTEQWCKAAGKNFWWMEPNALVWLLGLFNTSL